MIVILDLIGEESVEREKQTVILNGFDYKFDMPIHMFMRNDFEHIATEIDTLPDFINYLNIRELLYNKKVLTPTVSELDLLTIFKTKYDIIEKCLNGECEILITPDDLWLNYQKKHKEVILKRNIANQPSYIIDDVIV